MTTTANTVSYETECEQQGLKIKSTGQITYNGNSFEGIRYMNMGPSAGGMTVTIKTTGKWVGRCE